MNILLHKHALSRNNLHIQDGIRSSFTIKYRNAFTLKRKNACMFTYSKMPRKFRNQKTVLDRGSKSDQPRLDLDL